MKKEAIFGIRGLKDWKNLSGTFENVLGLIELNSTLSHEEATERKNYKAGKSNTVKIIWIETGKCTVTVDGTSHELREQSFFLTPPSDSLRLNKLSPDFKAKMLIVEKTFMDECAANKQILSFYNCLFVKRLLQTELEEEEILFLNKAFHDLKEKVERHTHSFYKELVADTFKVFLLELTHILNNKDESKAFRKFTRKEEVFNKFMDLLLEHYKEQHEVAFYADKLFITPQYLTMIIKSLTGKTTNKWIDETLVLEARKLLKTTQAPVQQIADHLNFSDQSTFGKFFKKYHGISPVEYRKLQYNSPAIAV